MERELSRIDPLKTTVAGNLQHVFSSSQVNRKERDTADVTVLTFPFSVWMSDSVDVMGCMLTACPETLIFPKTLHLLGPQKNRCVMCAGVTVTVLHFFTSFLNEHWQSWTHWQHLCLRHLQKRPPVKKWAIFQSGDEWDARVVLFSSHSKSHSYVGLCQNTPGTDGLL